MFLLSLKRLKQSPKQAFCQCWLIIGIKLLLREWAVGLKDHRGKNNVIKPATHILKSWWSTSCEHGSKELNWHFSSLPQEYVSGGGTIPFVLTEDWPLDFILEWGERTTQTLLELWPAPCGTKEVGQIRSMDPAWGEQLIRGNEMKGQKKVCIVNFERGKKLKSSLAVPCAIYSVALSLRSFPVE